MNRLAKDRTPNKPSERLRVKRLLRVRDAVLLRESNRLVVASGSDDHDGRELRGGELRNVRASLRTALPLHVAQPPLLNIPGGHTCVEFFVGSARVN